MAVAVDVISLLLCVFNAVMVLLMMSLYMGSVCNSRRMRAIEIQRFYREQTVIWYVYEERIFQPSKKEREKKEEKRSAIDHPLGKKKKKKSED